MNDQEFFTVHHALTINVEPLAEHFTLPSHEIFEAEIPRHLWSPANLASWNNSVIAHAWS